MPIYEYNCPACDENFDKMLPMSQYDDPQVCPTCKGEAKKCITAVGVIFKGDDWASKNNRIAGQMKEKNKRLSTNQNSRKKEAPVATLAPNVDGERVGTWAEAQSLAASKGKDSTTYAPKVAAEQAKMK